MNYTVSHLLDNIAREDLARVSSAIEARMAFLTNRVKELFEKARSRAPKYVEKALLDAFTSKNLESQFNVIMKHLPSHATSIEWLEREGSYEVRGSDRIFTSRPRNSSPRRNQNYMPIPSSLFV